MREFIKRHGRVTDIDHGAVLFLAMYIVSFGLCVRGYIVAQKWHEIVMYYFLALYYAYFMIIYMVRVARTARLINTSPSPMP